MIRNFDEWSVQLTTEEAKLLLSLMGFVRDHDIVQSDAEYYFKEKHPMATFDIPIGRDLSKAHTQKLLKILKSFMGGDFLA